MGRPPCTALLCYVRRMHPLIARFLNLPATVALLEKGRVEGLDADEAALVAEAERAPKERAVILEAKGRAQPSNEVQQQAIILLTRAATARLESDPTLGPKALAARAALAAEGATSEEANALVSQVLLEEAFGYASNPSYFDADYVAETLDSLIPLARLNTELVDDWLDQFVKRGPKSTQALRLSVAETLLEAAWSEGPQPVTFEHLDDTLERLTETVASSELLAAKGALEELVDFLKAQAIIGPQRAGRLTQLIRSAASEGASDSEDGEDDLEEDEPDKPTDD